MSARAVARVLRGSALGRLFRPKASEQSGGGEEKALLNFEEALFNLMVNVNGKVVVGKLLKAIEEQGILRNDPRLEQLMSMLSSIAVDEPACSCNGDPVLLENLAMDKETFIQVVKDNRMIISKSLRAAFVLPEFRKFCAKIKDIYTDCKKTRTNFRTGKVSQCIPESGRVDPEAFGVAVCTIDGQRFSIGDAKEKFLLMSGCNVMSYAIARAELDCDVVHAYVGQEPGGRQGLEFALDHEGRPHNPLIDSGGIMIAALIQKLIHRPSWTNPEIFDWISRYFERLSGGMPFTFNKSAYDAMKDDAAYGNFAQAFYMKANKSFPPNVDLAACMGLYLQCKAMEATCETLAVVAAMLANGGVNPMTEESVLPPDAVTDTLAMMHSCGLREYSGHFAFTVGTPAKSSPSGFIMVVVPNVLGYCVWSPPVDKFEISMKGLAFSQKIVDAFPFHPFDNMKLRNRSIDDPRRPGMSHKSEAVVSLLFAAAAGDVTALRRKFLAGQDMMIADYDCRTPLHLAAAEGHIEAVDFLVNTCRVSPNAFDRWGRTPLDDAQLFDHWEIVEILEDAGAECVEDQPARRTRHHVVTKNGKLVNKPLFRIGWSSTNSSSLSSLESGNG